MRSSCSILFLLAVILMTAGLGAQTPSVVLPDGGIQFQDDTILNSAARIDPPATATVAVDCGSGDSINEALETPAVELTVEIDGTCTENVVIQRDNVTLRGDDESTDGIHGDDTGGGATVVRIVESMNVQIENLTIAEGVYSGLIALTSRVKMNHCTVTGNGNRGVAAFMASRITLNDVSVHSNDGGGLAAYNGSEVTCDWCDLSGNGTDKWAVYSFAAGYFFIDNSTISGDNGVSALMSGFAYLEDTPISATGVALFSGEQGDINYVGRDDTVQISGAIQVDWKAFLWAFDINQSDATVGNKVGKDSTLSLEYSTVLGLDLEIFSNGDALDSTVGDITCASGSDFYCHGTSSTPPTTSTCDLCPVVVRPSERGAGPVEREGPFRKLPDRFPRKVSPFAEPDGPFLSEPAGGIVLERP